MKIMRSLSASIAVLLLVGCNLQDLEFEDIQGIRLDGDFAAPIGEATYFMSELLLEVGDTSALRLGPDSIYYLQYTEQITFNAADDIVSIGDIVNNASFELPVTPPVGSNQTVVFDTTLYFEYSANNNERIDSVFYNAGDLILNASLAGTTNVNFDITVPTTVNIGINQAVSFSGSTNYNGAPYSLSNHKTAFTFQGGINVYSVDVHLEIPLITGQQIPAGETFNLDISFLNQDFEQVFGRFGRDTVTVGNTVIDVPFFEDFTTEGFFLDAPTITFDVVNSFGLPFGLLLGGIYSVDDDTGTNDTTYLGGSITRNPQTIAAGVPGGSQLTSVVVNKSNSTLGSLLASTPGQIGFNIQAVTNSTDPNALNFISGTNEIQADILVRLDLAVRLEDLSRDIVFNLSGGLDFNEVDSAVLRIVTVNGLPFSGRMEVNILGAAQDTLYTSPQELVLQAPFLNNNGTVRQARNNTANIILGPDGVEALKTGSKVALHVVLNTTESLTANDIYVKIRASDKIEIKASVVAGINFEF